VKTRPSIHHHSGDADGRDNVRRYHHLNRAVFPRSRTETHLVVNLNLSFFFFLYNNCYTLCTLIFLLLLILLISLFTCVD
jgi:hypothetical protein